MNTSIGERLKAERERLRLSQPAFAEICGVKKNAQIKYEKGERMPDLDYIQRLIEADIGVDVLWVISNVRAGNAATTPTELAYLRNCRAFPTQDARMAGLNSLVALRNAYGVPLYPDKGSTSTGTLDENEEIVLDLLNFVPVEKQKKPINKGETE
ncbi:helix-turn-helix domain-containing protein [Methylomonas sp. 11b]|uniref:helix-turn-helix domain-containing protein n=1 Tax=Methylomonas sp. 11b TaxID=1168169 RepID=UPI00047B4169|nr:helix-turn-helix transcriptional regulator [Methylomonas sp. 11b]